MPKNAKHTPKLEFHKGMDYAVILKPGQTTDNPLASLYGIDREVTKYGWLFSAAPKLLASLKALRLECLADPINPCWDNRPTDKPGLHWGSEPGHPFPACSSCNARAAIAAAEG